MTAFTSKRRPPSVVYQIVRVQPHAVEHLQPCYLSERRAWFEADRINATTKTAHASVIALMLDAKD